MSGIPQSGIDPIFRYYSRHVSTDYNVLRFDKKCPFDFGTGDCFQQECYFPCWFLHESQDRVINKATLGEGLAKDNDMISTQVTRNELIKFPTAVRGVLSYLTEEDIGKLAVRKRLKNIHFNARDDQRRVDNVTTDC